LRNPPTPSSSKATTTSPWSRCVQQFFAPSDHTSSCPWKGEASYYHVVVDGRENRDAAWYYPSPKAAAAEIAGRVAFWRGVEVRP